MANYILGIAAIMRIYSALNKISSKIGIQMILAFILLGMLFGSDGIVKLTAFLTGFFYYPHKNRDINKKTTGYTQNIVFLSSICE